MANTRSSKRTILALSPACKELQRRELSCFSNDVRVKYSWPFGDIPRCVISFFLSSTRFASLSFESLASFESLGSFPSFVSLPSFVLFTSLRAPSLLSSAAFISAACLMSNSTSLWVARFKYAALKRTRLFSRSCTNRSRRRVGMRREASSAMDSSVLHQTLHRSVSPACMPGLAALSNTSATMVAATSTISIAWIAC